MIKNKKSTMSEYLASLRKYPQLKHSEVVFLFKELENSEKNTVARAREQLIQCNLRLVVSIAKKFKGHNIPIEDLIQEGNIGLMKSIERFDWTRGCRFSTYASWWVRQSIGQHILKCKRIVRLPAHAATLQRKLIQASEKYKESNNGVEPTHEELVEITGASKTVAKAMTHSARGCVSLNQTTAAWKEMTLEDSVEDDTPNTNPFDNLANKEILGLVKQVLKELSYKEAAILRLRFGLVDDCANQPEYSVSEDEKNAILRGESLR